jgi:hypothetical protein
MFQNETAVFEAGARLAVITALKRGQKCSKNGTREI